MGSKALGKCRLSRYCHLDRTSCYRCPIRAIAPIVCATFFCAGPQLSGSYVSSPALCISRSFWSWLLPAPWLPPPLRLCYVSVDLFSFETHLPHLRCLKVFRRGGLFFFCPPPRAIVFAQLPNGKSAKEIPAECVPVCGPSLENQSSSKSIAFWCSTLHMLNMLAPASDPDDVGLAHCRSLCPSSRSLEMYSGIILDFDCTEILYTIQHFKNKMYFMVFLSWTDLKENRIFSIG